MNVSGLFRIVSVNILFNSLILKICSHHSLLTRPPLMLRHYPTRAPLLRLPLLYRLRTLLWSAHREVPGRRLLAGVRYRGRPHSTKHRLRRFIRNYRWKCSKVRRIHRHLIHLNRSKKKWSVYIYIALQISKYLTRIRASRTFKLKLRVELLVAYSKRWNIDSFLQKMPLL